MHILICEDDAHIASFVSRGLQSAGYQTSVVGDGASCLLIARQGEIDMIILDIGLPAMNGFTVLETLRGEGVRTPVIVLTARDSVFDTVAGLEGGANDYMTKPFQFAELLARVKLRIGDSPVETAGTSLLTHRDLSVDIRSRRVTTAISEVDLTTREFTLLEVFIEHQGQVLSRDQLIAHIWGLDFDPASNVVDVYVRSLRSKIGADRIETIRGAGYRLK
ncbi:response regulator transcription factor [Glutamicibacter sp. PS]|uniref:response regulator transcription factor n=1 Tax=Glutamicibacter sp. PS TaxID=3075634 RepID=UPI00285064B2|nr:response regulator transcription factor [Glutamicibacter sp. PS]MDR4534138.1 response regulator transcription factor [Glutamicibacter sp. PS]